MKIVKIVNLTRDAVVLEQALTADNFYSRMKGLLGRSSLAPGQGMVLKPANSVHTLGMKFAIDVAFVDRKGIVLRVIEKLPPGCFSPLVRRSYYVIEMAAGELDKSGTVKGDELFIE